MKILVVADIHSYLTQFARILDIVDFDLLVIAGDLTHYKPEDVVEIDSIVSRYTDEAFAVHGNCDVEFRNVYDSLKFIHSRYVDLDDVRIHGVGGSPYTPFNTPTEYSEDEIRSFMRRLEPSSSRINILLSHSPPRGFVDETMSGERAGSLAIRERIGEFDAVLCGHIHESPGIERAEEGRKAIVINPGPAAWRRFAILRTGDGLKAELRRVR